MCTFSLDLEAAAAEATWGDWERRFDDWADAHEWKDRSSSPPSPSLRPPVIALVWLLLLFTGVGIAIAIVLLQIVAGCCHHHHGQRIFCADSIFQGNANRILHVP